MKIKIAKEELKNRLGNIQNIVERKTTLPVLSNFLIEISNEKSFIYATDLETAIKEPFSVLEADSDVKLCIPAKKIYEIAKEVDEDILIEDDDSDWIRLKSGKSNFRIACINPDDYPQWPFFDNMKTVSIKSKLLLSMIEKTIYCAGESDTRYTLNGLLFHVLGESKQLFIVGTDGHRLASTYHDIELEEDIKVIIPRKSILELRKFLTTVDDNITMEISQNHIMFHIKDMEFLSKLIEGTYPNYEQVIPKGNDKILTINREQFIKALRRVSVMSRERSHAVRLDFSQEGLSIFATDPELGDANDHVAVNYEGEPLSLGFNAKYIIDVLSSMETENIVFELLDLLSPTLLKEEGNERYNCVIMPMRT